MAPEYTQWTILTLVYVALWKIPLVRKGLFLLQHFLEKLHDGIKSQEHQLLALQLLLQVVCRQPTWISKLVTTSVFKVIVKCLKVTILSIFMGESFQDYS